MILSGTADVDAGNPSSLFSSLPPLDDIVEHISGYFRCTLLFIEHKRAAEALLR